MQRYQFANASLRNSGRSPSARGQELDSLLGSDALRGRFFSWRGASATRYVCSVFQRGEEGFVSEVESGVVIGVARDGAGLRPVCVFSAQKSGPRRSLRELAHELGVVEWHVHFCAETAIIKDLAASLLN